MDKQQANEVWKSVEAELIDRFNHTHPFIGWSEELRRLKIAKDYLKANYESANVNSELGMAAVSIASEGLTYGAGYEGALVY